MTPRTAAAVVAVLGVLRSARAGADTPPSVWDIAADPAARDRWNLHVHVEHFLDPPEVENPTPFQIQRDEAVRLEAARAMLEEAGADKSPDVRLRFDLGVVYERIAALERRDDFEQKVIDVLAPALAEAPDHPAATQAYDALVYAYAKLDRPRDELATWRRYIPLIDDDRARVAPLMNMGEAEMRLGLLDAALATFRDGLRMCESLPNSTSVNATYALTLWDLAVALDRSGDPSAALSTAAKARGWTWQEIVGMGSLQMARTVTGWDAIRDDETVFFVPDWEREWYLALGEAAAARHASDPRDAAKLWQKAEDHWSAYVDRATAASSSPPPAPSGDRNVRAYGRWVPIARARLERAHAARVQAEKRAEKLPPRPRPAPSGNDE